MSANGERILTTHTGSLPRPLDLIPMLYARDRGEPYDKAKIAARTREAVAEVVARQVETGIDVVNDGEASKVLYSTYVQDRLTGYTGTAPAPAAPSLEAQEFPEFYERLMDQFKASRARIAACEGPITYRGFDALAEDLSNMRGAVKAVEAIDRPASGYFLSAASPGIIATYLPDRYYGNDETYCNAIAEAMKNEYDAIHEAGFILQLDCPDLAFEYTNVLAAGKGLAEFRAMVEYRVAALNHATRDIPADRMRMHICWGNGATPHHYDVPLKEIVDLVLQARPAGLSFEGANPRHGHEWKVWESVDLPDGKYLIPGVIDSTTNFIEHPELVAERILRYAAVVGPERVMAGVDCGLATAAGSELVDRRIAWAKLGSLVDGTRIANQQIAAKGLHGIRAAI